MASPFLYQPSPRYCHCAAQIGEKAYLWGGRTQNFSTSGRKTLKSEIQIFDSFHETWSKKNVNGAAPPGLMDGACTVVSETLYHFGGRDGPSVYNNLHSLDTVSLDGRALHGNSQNPADQPMPKYGCGLVTYTDAASLVLFAGYGVPHGPSQPGSRFVQDTNYSDGRGWTNELHLFNLTNGKWTSPTTTGERPPPCASFSFTAINHHKAVMFGGNHAGQLVNDVYIIDFHSMVWTKLERPEGATWPVERSAHAACCLNYGDDHPQLLVTGGLDKNLKTLSDGWLLDVNTGRWRELTLPEGTQPRWAHTLTACSVCPGRVHATTFGGIPEGQFGKPDDAIQKLAETTVMEFESVQSGVGSPTSEWVLVGTIGTSELGTPERVAQLEKMKQKRTDHGDQFQPPVAAGPLMISGFPAQLPAMQPTLPHLHQSTTLPVHTPTLQIYHPAQFPVPPTVPTLQPPYSGGRFQEMFPEQLPSIPPIEPPLFPYHAQSLLPHSTVLPLTQSEFHPVVRSTPAYQVEASTAAAPSLQHSTPIGPLDTLWTTVSATSPHTTYTDTPLQESLLPRRTSQTVDKPKLEQLPPMEKKPSHPDIKLKMDFTPIKEPGAIKTELKWEVEEDVKPKWEVEEDVKPKQVFSVSDIEKGDLIEQLTAKNKLLLETISRLKEHIAEKDLTLDVYKAAGVIAGKRKQLEASKEGVVLKKQRLSDEATGESAVLDVEVGSEDKPAGMNKIEVKNQQIQTEIVKTVEQHVQAGSTAQQQGYLRGVEVIDHITITYTGSAQSFHWRKFGFKIHLPDHALPPGVNECRIQIQASLSGQFQFPEDTEILSSVYWVTCPHKFAKPVTVEIQHCAKPEHLQHPSRLTFIVAKCNQESLPYKFKILDRGVFSSGSRYGSIELTQFSGFGVAFQSVMQWLGLRSYQPQLDPKNYCARLYYSSSGTHSWEVYFAITWDLELHISAIDAKYIENAAKVGPNQIVTFEADEIKLDIAVKGVDLKSGWTITPYTHPGITKHQVDHFVPGSQLPSCQLYVKWTGHQEQPPELLHRVKLLGAKEPNNFFLIRLPVPQALPEVAQQMPMALGNSCIQKSGGAETKPTKPELKDLMNTLYHKVADKWKMIGVLLEIPKGKLASIAEKYRGDPHTCLLDMLETWLERVDPPATWAAIIDAVAFLGEEELGRELKDKYTQ